jgi:alpha/beta superfamily hydrolase
VTLRAPQHTVATEIPGPAGALEAAIDSSAAAQPIAAAAVICHPHPQQQGTMHNKVVTTLARAFVHLGAEAVRFNFRGVGGSSGSYAHGVGERADASAVVAWSRERWPSARLYLAGFSFGAATALAIAATVAPSGLVTVAPPISRLPTDFVPPACPWLLVHGGADDVVPPGPVLDWCATLPVQPRVVLLDGVGHFFHGRLPALAAAVADMFGADFAAARG